MSFRKSKVNINVADPIDEFRRNTKTEEMEIHPPIPTKVFIEHLKYMGTNDNQLLVTEFSTIPMSPDFPRDISEVSYNMEKNRYDNILPYDHTRVNISTMKGTEGSDYINGSHIDVSTCTCIYTCTVQCVHVRCTCTCNDYNDYWYKYMYMYCTMCTCTCIGCLVP